MPSLPRTRRSWAVRAPLLVAIALFAVVVGWLELGRNYPALEELGVPTMQPRFVDARSIAAASVALAQGLDPLETNPGDPLGRPMNYPRTWLVLAWLGLAPQHATWLALAFIAAFATGLLALLPLATTRAAAWCLALGVLSPAVWLGTERANSDLPMFALTALAAAIVVRAPWFAGALVGAAAALKLFPVFALAGIAGLGTRRALYVGITLAIAFGVYAFATRNDIAAIQAHTAHWDRIAYGIVQLPHVLAGQVGWAERTTLLLGIGLLVAALVLGLAARRRMRLDGTPATLAAFQMAAAIHVGTFCTGSHFDYRLVFLLLALPQLATWATVRGHLRAGSVALIAAILLSLWGMTWTQWLRAAGAESTSLLFDEAIGWLLTLGLVTRTALTLPDNLVPRAWRGARVLDELRQAEPARALPGPAAVAAVGAARDSRSA